MRTQLLLAASVFILIPVLAGCGGTSDSHPLPDQAVLFSPPDGLNLSCEEECRLTGVKLNGDELASAPFSSFTSDQVAVGLFFPSPNADYQLSVGINLTDPSGIKTGTRLTFGDNPDRFAIVSVRDSSDEPDAQDFEWTTDRGEGHSFSPGSVLVTYRDAHQIRLQFEDAVVRVRGTGVPPIDLDGNTVILNLDKLGD